MFYGNQVQDTRQMFFSSWQKYRLNQPLSALEEQIVNVIIAHPEYHSLLNNEEATLNYSYFPTQNQNNPFLHMGLHIAIREQLATDRPLGIRSIFQQLLQKVGEPLAVEHLMMENLAECLWISQRDQQVPNEKKYLAELSHLLNC